MSASLVTVRRSEETPTDLVSIMAGYVDLADEAIALIEAIQPFANKIIIQRSSAIPFSIGEVGLEVLMRSPSPDKLRHVFEELLLTRDGHESHIAMLALLSHETIPFNRVQPFLRANHSVAQFPKQTVAKLRDSEVITLEDLFDGRRTNGGNYCFMHERALSDPCNTLELRREYFPAGNTCRGEFMACCTFDHAMNERPWRADGETGKALMEGAITARDVVQRSVIKTLKRVVDCNLVDRARSLYNSLLLNMVNTHIAITTIAIYALEKRRTEIVRVIFESNLLRFRRCDTYVSEIEGVLDCIVHYADNSDADRAKQMVVTASVVLAALPKEDLIKGLRREKVDKIRAIASRQKPEEAQPPGGMGSALIAALSRPL
jgi:hypothetical protein